MGYPRNPQLADYPAYYEQDPGLGGIFSFIPKLIGGAVKLITGGGTPQVTVQLPPGGTQPYTQGPVTVLPGQQPIIPGTSPSLNQYLLPAAIVAGAFFLSRRR